MVTQASLSISNVCKVCNLSDARVATQASLSINNGGACAEWPTGAFTLAGNTSFRGPDIDGCASADGGRGSCAWQSDLSFLGNIPQERSR